MTIDTEALEKALKAYNQVAPPNRRAWIEAAWAAMPSVRELLRSHAEKVPCENPIQTGEQGSLDPASPEYMQVHESVWEPCGTCDPCLIRALNERLP